MTEALSTVLITSGEASCWCSPPVAAEVAISDSSAYVVALPVYVQIMPGLYVPRGEGTMSQFTIKQNDALPKCRAQLLSGGAGVDLTGATVKFCMRPKGNPTPKVNTSAAVIAATSGTVEYVWTGTDTDTAGEYEAEFEVTFSGGSKQTFPTSGYIAVTIVDDVA